MKYVVKHLLQFTAISILVVISFSGCTSEEVENSKSLEQIQKEEGIPVTLEKITQQKFDKELTFFGKFKR